MPVFSILLVSWIMLLSAIPAFAGDNLLANPDFEDWSDDGELISWEKSAKKVLSAGISSASSEIKNGTRAAGLVSTSKNEQYISQNVDVTPGSFYHYSGFIKNLFGDPAAALRINWYAGNFGSYLSSTTSEAVIPSGEFTELVLETYAPDKADSAKLKLVFTPKSSSSSGLLADSFFFSGGEAPAPNNNNQSDKPDEEIAWDFKSTKTDGSFAFSYALKNFSAATEYRLKIRGGIAGSRPDKIQTFASGTYLSDTESWDKFTGIKTDNNGSANGEVAGRLKPGLSGGDYSISLRIKENDGSNYWDSGERTVKLSAAVPPVEFEEDIAGEVLGVGTVSGNSESSISGEDLPDPNLFWDTSLPAEDETTFSSQSATDAAGEGKNSSIPVPLFAGLGLVAGGAITLAYSANRNGI